MGDRHKLGHIGDLQRGSRQKPRVGGDPRRVGQGRRGALTLSLLIPQFQDSSEAWRPGRLGRVSTDLQPSAPQPNLYLALRGSDWPNPREWGESGYLPPITAQAGEAGPWSCRSGPAFSDQGQAVCGLLAGLASSPGVSSSPRGGMKGGGTGPLRCKLFKG